MCEARTADTRGAARGDPPVSAGQAVEAVTLGLPVTVATTAVPNGGVVGVDVAVRVGVGVVVVGAAVVGAAVGVGVARTVSGAHASPAIRAIENSALSTPSLVMAS